MALELNSITRMSDMMTYAKAEAAVAAQQCPGAYNDYMEAVRILEANAKYEGTSLEATWVDAARQAILEARKTWYAIGCSAPTSGSSASVSVVSKSPVQIPVTSTSASMAGSELAKFLLAGGALFVIMLAFAKEPPKRRTYTKRKTTKRRTTRRRYR